MVDVILVDENDNPIGTAEKLEAHKNGGKLHRALSIFIFNDKDNLYIQRRALTKYHSAGKWANTCCSHPMPNENILDAAHRRLKEEMGFDCNMEEVFNFPYKAYVGNGLTEYEFDHIIFGRFNGVPKPAPEEVMDWRLVSLDDVKKEIDANKDNFAAWFVLMIDDVSKHFKEWNKNKKR
ncbi:MAG: isopentenyl-diphosphate Delta-isomerase [Candidatus Micrarchaeia archaeon]